MKYKKNQYSEGFSFCATVIGIGFIALGISNYPYLYSNLLWFIISITIGVIIIGGQFAIIANRGRIRKLVKIAFEMEPDASIEKISKTTGITEKDVQTIILDLKLKGEFKGAFSPTTGAAITIQEGSSEENKVNYCHNCGTPIRENNATFCAYCGAKILVT